MGLGARLTRHFFARSERVKAVDVHPSEPLLASALYDGRLRIFDHDALLLLAEIDASPLPLRSARFVSRRGWVLAAGDDCAIRCFSIHSQEKVAQVSNAHRDYIRHLDVHSSKSFVLSSSDDMTIKLWDFDQAWALLCTFEGHAHYVMQTQWNPRDSGLFASCSLDRSIKVWGVGNILAGAKPTTAVGTSGGTVVTSAHFTLLGHERGVNAIAYSKSGERPYLVSGSDDCTVRVWDYQTKQCIQVLKGHTGNVCAVLFASVSSHSLPVLFSAGEDGQLMVWHALTYQREATLDLALERAWTLSIRDSAAGEAETGSGAALGGLVLAVGGDAGSLILKMGQEGPVVSAHGGKCVVSKGLEVVQLNLRLCDEAATDGDKIMCPTREMGQAEFLPRSICHHPNGRFLAVVGDGEFVIYTAQTLRSKTFGACEGFCWSSENHYATLEKGSRVKIFCNFEETFNFTPPFDVEEVLGGYLLGLRSQEFVCFYDWNSYRLIRRIDVIPKAVWWSPSGLQVAISAREPLGSATGTNTAGVDRLYVLRHDKYAVMAANTAQALEEEGGIEIAFDLIFQAQESLVSGLWVGEYFLFTTRGSRLKGFCGGRVETLKTLEAKQLVLLAALPEQDRLFLMDGSLSVYSYALSHALLEYQVEVSRGELDAAKALLSRVPVEGRDAAARALQAHGYVAEALEVARDEQLRFDLALSLGKLDICTDIIAESAGPAPLQRRRWASVGDSALSKGLLSLAAKSFWECGDMASLLLLYSSSGDAENLKKLAEAAKVAGQHQIAFVCLVLTKQFHRTYCPSLLEEAVAMWKKNRAPVASLKSTKDVSLRRETAAGTDENANVNLWSPACPSEQPDAFPKLQRALQVESLLQKRYALHAPARVYTTVRDVLEADVLRTLEEQGPEALQKLLADDELVLPPSGNIDETAGNEGNASSVQWTEPSETAATQHMSPVSKGQEGYGGSSPKDFVKTATDEVSRVGLQQDNSVFEQIRPLKMGQEGESRGLSDGNAFDFTQGIQTHGSEKKTDAFDNHDTCSQVASSAYGTAPEYFCPTELQRSMQGQTHVNLSPSFEGSTDVTHDGVRKIEAENNVASNRLRSIGYPSALHGAEFDDVEFEDIE